MTSPACSVHTMKDGLCVVCGDPNPRSLGSTWRCSGADGRHRYHLSEANRAIGAVYGTILRDGPNARAGERRLLSRTCTDCGSPEFELDDLTPEARHDLDAVREKAMRLGVMGPSPVEAGYHEPAGAAPVENPEERKPRRIIVARQYLVNEIFLSVQGEGVRQGTLNVFVRFSRCNMRCRIEEGPKSPGGFDCDTEFESGRWMTAAEIVAECERLWPGGGEPWIVATGGEPALQLDLEIISELKSKGWRIAVETNGSILLPVQPGMGGTFPPGEVAERLGSMRTSTALSCFAVDWITVSPKVAEHAIRQRWAHEVKYVRGGGQAAPKTSVNALHHVVSPSFSGLDVDPEALRTCIEIVRTTPPWRLSVQNHKGWRVR